jgi:hypothetical protein
MQPICGHALQCCLCFQKRSCDRSRAAMRSLQIKTVRLNAKTTLQCNAHTCASSVTEAHVLFILHADREPRFAKFDRLLEVVGEVGVVESGVGDVAARGRHCCRHGDARSVLAGDSILKMMCNAMSNCQWFPLP